MLLKRRAFKLSLPVGEINVVSLMDILTVLLFFLLIAASFSRLSAIDGGAIPSVVGSDDGKPKFSLEVIMTAPREMTVWIGPYEELKMVDKAAFERFVASEFTGNPAKGYIKKITAHDPATVFSRLQSILLSVKKTFPHESSAILAVSDKISYQEMIDSMGAIRSLGESQTAFKLVNLMGQEETTKVLFPRVIISEWSGGRSDGAS